MIKNTDLSNSLDIIFKDTESGGYWDPQSNYITERLIKINNSDWKNIKSNSHRYGFFTLSMILLAKDLYCQETKKYDTKIVDFIEWTYNHLEQFTSSELTYGALLSVVLGKKVYELEYIDIDRLESCLKTIYKVIMPLKDNQHALILITIRYFLNQKYLSSQFNNLKDLTEFLLSSYNKSRYFETGDVRAIYHQRIMYVLWGLIFASEYCFKEEIKKTAEATISYTWEKRRDKKDDGFLWHPALYLIKNKNKIKVPIYNPRSARYLFECHQTFFANSINFYQKFFNSNLFQEEKEKALEWIWGKNRINKDLSEVTGLGIPARIMDLNGNLLIKGQQFIGSYEIGSLILALAAENYNQINKF